MPDASDPYTIGSVDSALRLLLLLGDSGELRLTDAAQELGVARSTAHRVMQMLVRYGFAEQVPGARAYRAGAAWQVFSSHDGETRLGLAAHPMLAALARETGETAQLLALRPSGHTVSIAAAEGSNVVRAAARVGQRFPAHLTAGGRVLLGALPSAARELHLGRSLALAGPGASARSGERRATDATPALLEAIHRAADDGFSVQHDEYEPGTSAVAVPVRFDTRTIYSLDIVLPSSRLGLHDEPVLVDRARTAAAAIVATALPIPA